MRIVFDTNVFIAAVIKSGLLQDIVHFAATTDFITLLTSEAILEEISKKMIEKAKYSEADVKYYLNYLKNFVEIIKTEEKIDLIKRDPDDNKILECAFSGKADLIVSIDKDLLDLKTFQDIGIIHPKTLTWTFPEYFKKMRKIN